MARRGKASKGRRHQSHKATTPDPQTKSKSKHLVTLGLGIATAAVLVSSIVATNISGRGEERAFNAPPSSMTAAVLPAVSRTVVKTDFELEPKTLSELGQYTAAEREKIDLARINLLCASGMPTTEGLDIEYALSVLDEWAEKVAFATDRHAYRVHDPRPIYRDRYNGSEAHFRAEMLAQVLQEDLGVKYNLSAKDDFSFADPTVAFIHGMIPGPGQTTADAPGGTCTSMPVLYVAVGRRLGYPLRLVNTKGHLFARWDGEALYQQPGGHDNPAWRETFNCETTNGFNKFDDAYYKTWPFPVTDEEIARNRLLESLTATEAYAQFLASRGHHGQDLMEYSFAARCFENAHRNDPTRECYVAWFNEVALPCGYEPTTPRLQYELAMKRDEIENDKRQAETMKQARKSHQGPQIGTFGSYGADADYQSHVDALHKQYGHRVWFDPQHVGQAPTNNIGQGSLWPNQQPGYKPHESSQSNTGS